jgi:dCMP deaminase
MSTKNKHPTCRDNLLISLMNYVSKDLRQQTMEHHSRPNWDRYFLDLCEAVARRATCDRGRSGCVIVKDKRIMTTGYVGAPAGLPHCDEAGHDMRKVFDINGNVTQHCVRTLHAEQNAIIQAARFGIPLEGATLFCKMTPCRTCAMMIINAGIKRVVCEKRYHADTDTIDMFKQACVELTIVNNEFEKYDKQ